LHLLQLVDHLPGHDQLKPNITNEFLTPTLKRPCRVAELEAQDAASVGVLEGLRPPLHDSFCVTQKLETNRFKMKPVQRLNMSVYVEQQRHMVRAGRG
jgi:hypothetical protein